MEVPANNGAILSFIRVLAGAPDRVHPTLADAADDEAGEQVLGLDTGLGSAPHTAAGLPDVGLPGTV
jgi:hypothetical protein